MFMYIHTYIGTCDTGLLQSPIDISNATVSATLKPLSTSYHESEEFEVEMFVDAKSNLPYMKVHALFA